MVGIKAVHCMHILVDIKKRLWSGRRVFNLEAAFSSDQDVVVLFGPSGAGKSLTLQAIAGLSTPDAGQIVAGGRVLFDAERGIRVPARLRDVGYVFQDYALFPHLTVARNVAFGLKRSWPWHLPRGERLRLEEILDILELTPLGTVCPGTFPGDSASGWPWPGPSCAAPACFSWMNLFRRWMLRSGPKCGRNS